MSEIENRPNEILHACQEMWRAPQAMFSPDFAGRYAKAAQDMMAAQLSFTQAAMSINAKMLELWFDKTEAASPVHVAEDEKAREKLTDKHTA